MARQLAQIMTELNSTYNPIRDTYNSQLSQIDPQLQAEEAGLQAQKQDSFQQITDQANRRGLFYSGLPIAEEQRYTGQQFLPAIANLRGKYASQRFGLREALDKLVIDQSDRAQGIFENEKKLDEERRQFDAQLAAQREAAARSGGGGGGGSGYGVPTTGAPTSRTAGAAAPKTYIGSDDFRGRLAYLAQQGNADANVALRYSGNNGRYDGPVKSAEEYAALRRAGIAGNYYIPGLSASGSGSGLTPISSGNTYNGSGGGRW